MNEYLRERQKLVQLNLLVAYTTVSRILLRRQILLREQEITANHAAYLEEHGAEAIKKRFPHTWHECWPWFK